MTHSSFIANLFNPLERYALGDTFSKVFINSLKEKYPQILKEYTTPITYVEVEKSFGPEREEDGQAFGGRADIYLKDEQGHIIVIENKIFAGDQERQLERYWNSIGKKGIVIYLTLNGKNPSQDSLGKANDIKLINLSYKELVECIETCFKDTDNLDFKLIINQYIKKINELIMDSNIQAEILKSAKNMRAAIAIQENVTAAREMTTMEFMRKLSSILDGGPVSKKNTFWWFPCGKFEICIEWNLYIRIKYEYLEKDSFLEWEEGDNCKWKYVKINNSNINFHTFEGEAGRWLAVNERESFVNDIVEAIKKIIKN